MTRVHAKAIVITFVVMLTVGVFALMAFSPADGAHPGSMTGHEMGGMSMDGHGMSGH